MAMKRWKVLVATASAMAALACYLFVEDFVLGAILGIPLGLYAIVHLQDLARGKE